MKLALMQPEYSSNFHVKSNHRRMISGFTLLEMLIVLAVLGILIAAGLTTFAQQARQTLVRQAAVQVQADLEQLRSSAIRFNRNFQFRWSNAALNGYSVDAIDPVTAGAVVSKNRLLPDGVKIDVAGSTPTTESVTYVSPLATLELTPPVFRVQIPNSSSTNPLFVKIIGVTGRVVISATN